MNIFFIFSIAVLIGFIMSIPVGPVGIISIKRTIEHGRWYGFIAGSGSVFSEVIFATIVAFNIHYLSSFIHQYRMFIQIFGVAILVFVSLRMFFYKKNITQATNKEKVASVATDFFYTFIINLTNPAIIITFVIFLSIFHINHYLQTQPEKLAFITGDFFGSLLWFLTLSSTVSHVHTKTKRDIIPFVYKASGILLLIFIFIFTLEIFWEVFLR